MSMPAAGPADGAAGGAALRRFIVLGFPRSGTTLLSQLLDAHPQVSCPPETNLFSAAGRFLEEQTMVEGPPIGVLAGLNFLGVEADEVHAALRAMLFPLHARVAGGKPVWVEKTATDIFHAERLEPLLTGHARFIALLRNPLDVIASNRDLADVMGAQLPELFALTREVNGFWDGMAHAWIDRIQALLALIERQGAACHVMRYEDLLATPEAELSRLFAFMGLEAEVPALIERAFQAERRIGLGDFNVHATRGIAPPRKDGWRKRIPPGAVARIVPQLAPWMERLGYAMPKVRPAPAREDAVRQFVMAATMKRAVQLSGEKDEA